jgi:predicted dienelactone hydrolase
MRPLEIILIIVVLTAALIQVKSDKARWPIALIFIGILIAAWYAAKDGVPWQMFPVFVGLLLLLIWQLREMRSLRHATRKPLAALSIVALSTLSFALLLLIPMFTLPKPTGPYQVGTRIIYLKDTSRIEDQGPQQDLPRELVVQIWYPADSSTNHFAAYQRRSETTLATSYRSVLSTNSRLDAPIATQGSPFFVLLFNHGWGGRRTQDTFLTEDLASHGYVVAAIDHTYNAGRVAMPDHRIIDDAFGFDPISPEVRTATQIRNVWDKELNKWVADESFVLTVLQNDNLDKASPWYGRLNTSRAGAFGHSFGGAASVQICSTDPRIRAGLNMDGWTFGDISHRQPNDSLMFMYETASTPRPQDLNSKDRATRIETELDVNDMEEVDSSLKQYGGYKLFVDGTSHMDFTDHSLVFPWREWRNRDHISSARIQTIVRDYVLAFFNKTLREETPALLQNEDTSPFHEVHIEQFTQDRKPPPAETTQNSQLNGQQVHP